MDSSKAALEKFLKWKNAKTVLRLTKEEPEGNESLKVRGVVGFVNEPNGVINFEVFSPHGVVPILGLHHAEFVVAHTLVNIVFTDGTRFILEEETSVDLKS